jgi:TetR/AcrR family transcriptional regulator
MTKNVPETRQRMSAEERRSQLLDVAKRLFAAHGFDGVTTKKIAASAGVTEALIFRYFDSKDALYRAVIEAGVARSRRPAWRESVAQCMASNDDDSLFRHLIEFVIEVHRSDPVFQRVLVQATLAGHQTALRFLHRVVDPLSAQLADYVARRQREGAFCEGDPMGIVTAALGMARSYAAGKYIYRRRLPKISDEEAVELLLRMVLSGVKTSSKRRAPARRR